MSALATERTTTFGTAADGFSGYTAAPVTSTTTTTTTMKSKTGLHYGAWFLILALLAFLYIIFAKPTWTQQKTAAGVNIPGSIDWLKAIFYIFIAGVFGLIIYGIYRLITQQ